MTDGERWARERLLELRRSRYGLRGWQRFLAASFERAGETRALRCREHLQVLLVSAAGLIPWIAAAASGAFLLAAVGAVWWLLVMLMLDWHLGMLDDLDRLGPANVLSLARAGAVPAVALLAEPAAAFVFLAAGITDGTDGPLARRRGEQSRLGLWLDGGTDTLLFGTAAVTAARTGSLPWWAAALVLARSAMPWPLVAHSYLIRAERPRLRPSARLPGLVVFAGLALTLFRESGELLVVSGLVLTCLASIRHVRLGELRERPVEDATRLRA